MHARTMRKHRVRAVVPSRSPADVTKGIATCNDVAVGCDGECDGGVKVQTSSGSSRQLQMKCTIKFAYHSSADT